MFDLDADTTAITRHLGNHPVLASLVRRHPGLRVPGAWDPFEMSVRAVLGESIAGGAGPELGELARRFGERLSVSDTGGLSVVFPSAGDAREGTARGSASGSGGHDPIARGDGPRGRGRGIPDESARHRRIDRGVHRGPGLPAAGRLPIGRSGSAACGRPGDIAGVPSTDCARGALAPVALLRGHLSLDGERREALATGERKWLCRIGREWLLPATDSRHRLRPHQEVAVRTRRTPRIALSVLVPAALFAALGPRSALAAPEPTPRPR